MTEYLIFLSVFIDGFTIKDGAVLFAWCLADVDLFSKLSTTCLSVNILMPFPFLLCTGASVYVMNQQTHSQNKTIRVCYYSEF